MERKQRCLRRLCGGSPWSLVAGGRGTQQLSGGDEKDTPDMLRRTEKWYANTSAPTLPSQPVADRFNPSAGFPLCRQHRGNEAARCVVRLVCAPLLSALLAASAFSITCSWLLVGPLARAPIGVQSLVLCLLCKASRWGKSRFPEFPYGLWNKMINIQILALPVTYCVTWGPSLKPPENRIRLNCI